MGIGFVLLVWFGVAVSVAAVCAAGFAGVTYYACRRRHMRALRWVVAFLVMPFVWVGFVFAAFGAYAVWCETHRGVDPGIGDGWKVPLSNGYSFQAIDTWSNTFLTGPAGQQVHYGLSELGHAGETVFGKEPAGYFIVDTRTGSDRLVGSHADLEASLRAVGLKSSKLYEPSAFYARRRWSWVDVVAAAIVAGVPVLGFLTQVMWFVRSLHASGA